MSDLLFVYGTLCRGFDRKEYRIFSRHARYISLGYVSGSLYDLGDYSGMTVGAQGRVYGEVYCLQTDHLMATLEALDIYEGCSPGDPEPHEYQRRSLSVALQNGRAVGAMGYVLSEVPENAKHIAGGDYWAYSRAKVSRRLALGN